ncbi:hypothetical protein D621_14805 [beta proteobacterium AAP51]|nr:hypothetical protein D621_14805 [beta proteobacterium AAP51]
MNRPLCRVLLAAAACLPAGAAAQGWTAQRGTEALLRHDSNPGLASTAPAALTTLQWALRASLARRADSAETGAEAELVLSQGRSERPAADDTTGLGRLALRQRLALERQVWQGDLSYRRERPLDGLATAGEVALGRAEQSVVAGGLSWSYALDERLSAEVSAGLTDTRLSTPLSTSNSPALNPSANTPARSFAVATASTALRYAWTETTSLSASLQQTRQRLQDSDTRIQIDSLRLGATHALSERASLNLAVAQSRTGQDFTLRGLVCPLPVQFCRSGIVPFQVSETRLTRRREQLQYSAGGNLRWDPATTLAASATRALTPGPLGVNREDRWSLGLERSWSEALSASLSLDDSRTEPPAGTAAPARLRSLNLDARWRFSEPLTLVLQAQARRYRSSTPDSRARSHVFSISLQYPGATVPVGE